MTGTVRDSFSQASQLLIVDFSNNNFQGPIPESIFDSPTLEFAYFSNNSFTSPLPTNYDQPLNLQQLWIDGNMLTDEIPGNNVGTLKNLEEFLLQNNQFVGNMPASICELRNSGVLDELWADCGADADPRVDCILPQCCTKCFSPDTTR